jgi:hypothetical protein
MHQKLWMFYELVKGSENYLSNPIVQECLFIGNTFMVGKYRRGQYV